MGKVGERLATHLCPYRCLWAAAYEQTDHLKVMIRLLVCELSHKKRNTKKIFAFLILRTETQHLLTMAMTYGRMDGQTRQTDMTNL